MENTREEMSKISRIKQALAEKVSGVLLASSDGARKACGSIYVGEPQYPIELLVSTDEQN